MLALMLFSLHMLLSTGRRMSEPYDPGPSAVGLRACGHPWPDASALRALADSADHTKLEELLCCQECGIATPARDLVSCLGPDEYYKVARHSLYAFQTRLNLRSSTCPQCGKKEREVRSL